jgi:hypothetical protein
LDDVQAANASVLNGIGTDARVRCPTWEQYVRWPDMDKIRDVPSKEWSVVPFSLDVDTMGVMPNHPLYANHLGTMLPENRKTETAYRYYGDIANMEAEKVVSIRDLVGSELCISSNDGQKVFGVLKSAISKGNKVRISFENIKSISASFLDLAIGQLYNGEVPGNIDEKLSFDNISPGRRLITDRAVREAKAYYSDPEGYLAKMKKIFADD